METTNPLVPMELTPPQIVRQQITGLSVFCNECVISNDAEFAEAGDTLKGIREVREQVMLFFEPVVASRLKAHREATAERNAYTQPLDSAERIWKAKIAVYQEQLNARIEAENAKKMAEATKAAEDAKVNAAAAFEAVGQKAMAERVINASCQPIVLAPAVAPVKANGVSVSTKWEVEVSDMMALVLAVASGKVPITFLQADTKALKDFAKSTKGQMEVPGVVFKPVASVRGYNGNWRGA